MKQRLWTIAAALLICGILAAHRHHRRDSTSGATAPDPLATPFMDQFSSYNFDKHTLRPAKYEPKSGSSCTTKECPAGYVCCPVDRTCILAQCQNRVKDANETDTDCGGVCAQFSAHKCVPGQKCKVNSDCWRAECNTLTGTCK